MCKFCFHNFYCVLKVEFWIIVKKILSQSLLRPFFWLIMAAQGAVSSLGFESNFRNFFLLMVSILKVEVITATSLFLFFFPLLSPSYGGSVYSPAEIIVAFTNSVELAPNFNILFLFSHVTSPCAFCVAVINSNLIDCGHLLSCIAAKMPAFPYVT